VRREQRALKSMLLLAVFMLTVPCIGSAKEQQSSSVSAVQQQNCDAVLFVVEEQNRELRQELRQIKRELSLLNQNMERPGVREIITGIGFILGLFGAAALFSARRRSRADREE